MTDILQRIESYKREEIAAAKTLKPWNEVVAEAHDAPPVRRFLSALKAKRAAGDFDGVMLGRAAWHTPRVLSEISLQLWPSLRLPSDAQVVDAMTEYAARQVARELRLAHVWSWGWAQRNERSNDPDKTYAACVWLWARDPDLCDAPGILGKELDADRRAGQIDLAPGVRCVYGDSALTASAVASLAKVTGDRELALTALVVRAVERERTSVSPVDVVAAERRIVRARFGGSTSAYRTAVARAGASVAVTPS